MSRPRHRRPCGGNICDFCGAEDVLSLYRCGNFNWDDSPIFRTDTGRWAACYMCSKLIEKPNWTQLQRRVMREVAKRESVTRTELSLLRASLKVLLKMFSEHLVKGHELTIHRAHVRRFILAGD